MKVQSKLNAVLPYTLLTLPLASARLTLLVCDDGKNIRTVLTVCLQQRSHQAMSAPSAKGARIALAEQPFDLASVRCTDRW